MVYILWEQIDQKNYNNIPNKVIIIDYSKKGQKEKVIPKLSAIYTKCGMGCVDTFNKNFG